jgi:hypothetical protein
VVVLLWWAAWLAEESAVVVQIAGGVGAVHKGGHLGRVLGLLESCVRDAATNDSGVQKLQLDMWL